MAWTRYGALGAVLVLQLVATTSRRWVQDDGFINIRIAQQVAAGNGAVFNVGERVEAFTSPLWLSMLVVGRAVTFGLVPYEWLAVGLGLICSLGGTAGLLCGAVWLWTPGRARSDAAWWLPCGILVPLALPAFWDFATSGLETGLAWGWVGASFAVIAGAARRGPGEPVLRLAPRLLLVGLGPLVRPELALYSVAFGLALVVLIEQPRRRGDGAATPWWQLVLAWAAVPLAYQVFRMGYYANVVPNTALAKNATDSNWDRGIGYLANFVGPYRLAVPALLLLAGALLAPPLRRRSGQIVALSMVVPAALHVAYIVWIGGDYMHGRFWIVPTLALAAPLAAVPLPVVAIRSTARPARVAQLRFGVVALIAVWALVAATTMRPPRLDRDGHSIDDQRALMTGQEARAIGMGEHPVELDEQPYAAIVRADEGQVAESVDELLWRKDLVGGELQRFPRRPGSGTAVSYDAIGVPGVVFGLDTAFVDPYGLADPVAARQPPVSDDRAGHTHELSRPWRLARADVVGPDADAQVQAALRAMRCGQLGELLDGIRDPLTPGRFLRNIVHAPANSRLEIPTEPSDAEARFCPG